jgi:hypothetical protein
MTNKLTLAHIEALEREIKRLEKQFLDEYNAKVSQHITPKRNALIKLLLENDVELREVDKGFGLSDYEWKIYTTDKRFLEFLANKHNLKLYYVNGSGIGYVSDGKWLKVFSKASYVDEDYMITTLYKEDYNLKLEVNDGQ